ncbi:protein adenylyltransferase SelO [Granulosicoccus sp. 3-233]|uniref:protein adenylyltransferase SelO n=1 Tax=Granulosicoccus sp. 3-233 TaxID=3417969 RepID=UPI003D3424B9
MSPTIDSPSIAFDNSYAALPPEFYQRLPPTPVSQPELIAINEALARNLGIDADALRSPGGIRMLAGNTVPDGASPLAMAYAGHQFGNWVPQLGDGRAILLGEVIGEDGVRYDIQLKGAGPTPFSRGGDGRNWIGPVLREYVVSEAMAALGVPTTRALAAVRTGDHVMRELGPLPGAILTRVARSHVRVGTFQYFTARQNHAAVEQLLNYVIERHYPEAAQAEIPALALLDAVIDAQASLIAHWQSLGFIHGVMNTDNSSITGDTIDYGPCAFMDSFAADKVFSSIDRGARYAYQNQPRIAQWNLVNLAQCLLPLLNEDKEEAVRLAQESINRFDERFVGNYLTRMRAKLGLVGEQDEDLTLISSLLNLMQTHSLDFTLTFRQLSKRSATDPFAPGGTLHDWHRSWQQRVGDEATAQEAATRLMQNSNPVIIPRNHQVEAMIDAAVHDGNLAPFQALLQAVTSPFDPAHEESPFAAPPRPEEVVTRTFCGT